MLINEPLALHIDPILAMIATINGNPPIPKKLDTGIYQQGSFGSSDRLPGYENYPQLKGKEYPCFNCYGVCDNYQQILDQCLTLESPERQFVILITPVHKANQSASGGWRWHKWGPYIGTQKPTCEYLYDEPIIKKVYVYHIYEKVEK